MLKIVSAIGAFLILIAVAVIGVMAWNFFIPLKPEVEAFFAHEAFEPEGNVYVAWAGIHAPLGTKDLEAYGRERIAQGSLLEEKPAPPSDELRFQGETDGVCFDPADNEGRPCLGPIEIQALIDRNAELMERYRQLYARDYQSYSSGGLWASEGTYGKDLIAMNRVLNVHWAYQAQDGRGEAALQQWILNTRWLQHFMGDRHTLVEQAIFMVMYGVNLEGLPEILVADPELVAQYKDVLVSLLSKDFSADLWKVKATMQAEHNLIMSLREYSREQWVDGLFFSSNDMRNKFYAFARDFAEFSKIPADEYDQRLSAFQARHDYNCTDSAIRLAGCFPNIVGNLLLGGMVKGHELLRNAHWMTARQRMLIVWIEAKAENVEPGDMAAFLQAADAALYNPFTNAPFEWDAGTQSIHASYGGRDYDVAYGLAE